MKYKELIEANGLTLHGDIEHFADLVAAQEREECANMCMAVPRTGAYFARLIRARGTT